MSLECVGIQRSETHTLTLSLTHSQTHTHSSPSLYTFTWMQEYMLVFAMCDRKQTGGAAGIVDARTLAHEVRLSDLPEFCILIGLF